jgi:chemotaxis protein methyltransferase CheR
MRNEDCIAFLQWCLPKLGMKWSGFRKVRRQVCRRVDRRIGELGLKDIGAYRDYLDRNAPEWQFVDTCCRIPISRFYRDRAVFDRLRDEAIPTLLDEAERRGDDGFLCWCAGCAAGEEAYSIALIWRLGLDTGARSLPLRLIASDIDAHQIERAERGCYRRSALRELPVGWVERGFRKVDEEYCLRPEFRRGVEFVVDDIRTSMPAERFHLLLSRNLVFTYFDEKLQRQILGRLVERLRPGGVLVVGVHERLPDDVSPELQACPSRRGMYVKGPVHPAGPPALSGL